MKKNIISISRFGNRFGAALRLFASVLALPACVWAADSSALLDDFSDSVKASTGADRFVIDDASVGGKSLMTQSLKDGVLSVQGEIIPGRGQPGWMSIVMLTSPTGAPADLSKFEGIKIRIRINKGNVSLSANSAEVLNFDYHTLAITAPRGEFQDVKIPFKDMRRMWSEQTRLNPATINSISLVAADLRKSEFSYDVDEVRFY